jgi:hypothetical protein
LRLSALGRAISGDFVLIASEVNPALKALRDHGIEERLEVVRYAGDNSR